MKGLPSKKVTCAAMFSLMPVLAYAAGPPFKASLIPCINTCASGIPGTEDFIGPPEPATMKGLATVSSTGVLKVQVKGATADRLFKIMIAQQFGPPLELLNVLQADSSGDGNVNNVLAPGTYVGAIFLFSDTDINGLLEPRAQPGFVVEP